MMGTELGIKNAKERFREANSFDRRSIDMMAYELYSVDVKNKIEFIGILPERRKDPKRITKESILNWGRMILGNHADDKKIFYKCVTLDDNPVGVLGV